MPAQTRREREWIQRCKYALHRPRIRKTVLSLGIETSCDDTSAAVVRDGRAVLSNVATNQDEFHRKFGGIVPEIASRQHVALLSAAVEDALGRAGISLDDVNAIAVTKGPGLIGSLVVGVAHAKALAFAIQKPLYGINHLHGHIFAAYLDRDEEPAYPLLVLLVSGGHTQLVAVRSAVDMEILGRTRDDAAGEAYDKTARLLGLEFPGGPELDRLARDGDKGAVRFPRHRATADSLDMSFSGLKTSVRYYLEAETDNLRASNRDVAASFQAAVIDVLMDRVRRAWAQGAYAAVIVSGGVAANSALQAEMRKWGRANNVPVLIPPPKYCTDNAAMIAAAAYFQGESVRADRLALAADPNLAFETPLPV
ncbi:MAG: tRNA (adenosine(37)-N6)-threonylcarbamoyltransferase complex transferase subunit TsaD [Candidatus Eremiobacteraeota bacterium]|nr:tRNA (adenosine(37)-N6)-threonylcarbamoyltransferase complex transferase subunit TsaD [Candidatus Eremiobacteraeota bacterium]